MKGGREGGREGGRGWEKRCRDGRGGEEEAKGEEFSVQVMRFIYSHKQ